MNAYTNISLDTTATGIFVLLYCQIDMLKDSLEHMRQNALESLYKKKLGDKFDIITDIKNNTLEYDQKELEEEMRSMYYKCVKHHYAILE